MGNKKSLHKFSPEQELFLRASIMETKEAVSAWKEYRSRVDIDDIDPASMRMLPLLYRNLKSFGINDPDKDTFKGVYRLTWYKNQVMFNKTRELIAMFNDAGIKAMVLKGAALSAIYYKDPGLRHMSDIDLMIPSSEVVRVKELLAAAGWKPFGPRPLDDLTLKVRHAHCFKDAAGNEIDLHWHLLAESCSDELERDFWEGAVEFTMGDVRALTLNHTDHLLHVLVHGAEWNSFSSMRWMADAAEIMRKAGTGIDWQRLVRLSRELSLSLTVKNGLDYLRELVDVPVPVRVLEQIDAIPVSRLERKAYNVKMRKTGFMGMLPHSYFRYLINSKRERDARVYGPVEFLKFLKWYWGKERSWQLPAPGLAKTFKRVGLKR